MSSSFAEEEERRQPGNNHLFPRCRRSCTLIIFEIIF